MKSLIRFLVLIFSILDLSAQNETSQWYFGHYAAIDFITTPPTALTNSTMQAIEGCSSIADASGNLLFYTNGTSVWNKNHQVMANGTGLNGYFSSQQAALIAKQPGNTNLYYIFTQGANVHGLRYSIVDMSLATGMGSVTAKNSLLMGHSTEMLAGTFHCNGSDVWIVAHNYNSSSFSAYLLSSIGVQTTAVVSNCGSKNTSQLGGLKFSQYGNKLCKAQYFDSTENNVELFDFNNSTGVVSNSLILFTMGATLPADTIPHFQILYGCEFSRSGRRLYVARENTIFQWDLCAGSNAAILASVDSIPSLPNGDYGLQIAPNGKIYSTWILADSLHVINNPEASVVFCNYTSGGPGWAQPRYSNLGLPNSISGYLRPKPAPFTYTADLTRGCGNYNFAAAPGPALNCASFNYTVNSISWNFDDPASGNLNISSLPNTAHAFSSGGTYQVKLLYHYHCGTDTVKQTITIGPSISITANPGFTICSNQTATLTASGAISYTWNSGISSASTSVSPPVTHTYFVTGIDSAGVCFGTSTVIVSVNNCVGLEEFTNNKSLTIYPNPGNGLFTIETNDLLDVTVYDLLGKKMYESNYQSGVNTLDLSKFPNAIYIANCRTNNRS